MCKKSSGIWWRFSSERFSARALYFLLCIVLLLLPSPIFGLSPIERLNSIERRLQSIVIYSAQLEEELGNSQRISGEQQRNIEQLLNELESWRIRLEVSRNLLSKYRFQVDGLLSIIEQLEVKLKRLSESCGSIAQPLRDALTIAEKEIRRQKNRTVIYVILAAAAAGVAGYGIGRLAD